MLIASGRHTEADLCLWEDYAEADMVRSRTDGLKRLVDRSIAEIRRFNNRGDTYASISFGKDSVALAHLILMANERVPLVHIKAVPFGNPDCWQVRDAILPRLGFEYREHIADYGYDATEAEKDRIFFGIFRKESGRYFSGIRADESRGRKIRMRAHGLTSKNACAPLGWWSASDVFAYLAMHDLPVHPAYAMLGGGRWDRKQIRVDELGGDRGGQLGRSEWEQEYYGDELRRIMSRK